MTRRVVLIVVGALLALVGLGIGAGGVVLLAVFGGDGTVASGSHSLGTSTTALVSSVAKLEDVTDLADVVGDPRLEVSATATGRRSDLFLGVGPAARVERYLARAPYAEVTDFEIDPFELTRRPHAGSRRPAPPTGQDFWVAQGRGARASLSWKLRDGDYRLVLMKADGTRPVGAEGEVKLTLPHVARIAWALIAVGVVVLLAGVAAIVLGARSSSRAR